MIALALLAIPALALLNFGAGRYEWMLVRDKADPIGTKRLPGRPLLYVAPAVGAIAALLLPWASALAVFVAFVCWRGPSWGHVYQPSFVPTDRPWPAHEALCLELAGWNRLGAALIRHGYLLPAMLLGGLWAALALPFVIVGAYVLAERVGRPVVLAEP